MFCGPENGRASIAIHAGSEVLVLGWNAGQAGCRRGTGGSIPTGAHNILADPLSRKHISIVETQCKVPPLLGVIEIQ